MAFLVPIFPMVTRSAFTVTVEVANPPRLFLRACLAIMRQVSCTERGERPRNISENALRTAAKWKKAIKRKLLKARSSNKSQE
jgi:hypothetical protein